MTAASIDFTTKSVGAVPSVMDTGQPIVLTYNTSVAAQPKITNPGAGPRMTIDSTANAAQAGYVTCHLDGNVTKLSADFVYATGIHAWRDPFNPGLLALSVEGAVCHTAFRPNGWDYGIWNASSGLAVLFTRTYTTTRSNTATQHAEVVIDPSGYALVTGDDGVQVRVPASGTDTRIKAYNCTYAQVEIYYNNASTEPRAAVLKFSAETSPVVTPPVTPPAAPGADPGSGNLLTSILGWWVTVPAAKKILATAAVAAATVTAPTLVSGVTIHPTAATASAAARAPNIAIGGAVVLNTTPATATAAFRGGSARQVNLPYTLPILFGGLTDALIEAAPFTAVADVPAATVSGSVPVNPTPAAATAVVTDPQIQTGVTISAAPATATAIVADPVVQNAIPATAATASAALTNPVFRATVSVTATAATATGVFNAATAAGSGDVVLQPTAATATATLKNPAVPLTSTAMTATATVPNPVVQIPLSVTATAATATAAVRNPVVSANIRVDAVASTADAALTNPTVTITPEISYITSAETSGSSITIPAHNVGDLLLIFAWFAGAAQNTGAGFTTLADVSGAAGNGRVGYKIATATNDASGTWTNGQYMHVHVYRNASGPGAVASNPGNTTNTSVVFPALTLQSLAGSWVARAAYQNASSNVHTGTITGYTNRLAGNGNFTTKDTNGAVAANPTSATQTVNGAGVHLSFSVEIKL